MHHCHFSSFVKPLSLNTAFPRGKLGWTKPLTCRKSRIAINLPTSSNDSRFHFVHYIKTSSTFSRLVKTNISPTSWTQSKITLPPSTPSLIQKKYKTKENCVQQSQASESRTPKLENIIKWTSGQCTSHSSYQGMNVWVKYLQHVSLNLPSICPVCHSSG